MNESYIRIFRTFAELKKSLLSHDSECPCYELKKDLFLSFYETDTLCLDNEHGSFISTIIDVYSDKIDLFDSSEEVSKKILDDIETHSDLELILKYGRSISDEYILKKMNGVIKKEYTFHLELEIDDLDNFFKGEQY